MVKINFTFLIMLGLAVLTFGQAEYVTNPPGAEVIREEERRANRSLGSELNLVVFSAHQKRLEKERKINEKRLLSPDKEDVKKYASFFKLQNTGIAKIFPDVECRKNLVDADDFKCLQAIQMTGFGAYYSFSEKSNSGLWLDIYFAGNHFSVVKSPNIKGMFVELGNLPIESIQVNSPYLNELVNYKFTKNKAEKKSYSDTIAINPLKTYGLVILNSKDAKFDTNVSSRVIIIQILKKNEDNSLTFVWRMLQKT